MSDLPAPPVKRFPTEPVPADPPNELRGLLIIGGVVVVLAVLLFVAFRWLRVEPIPMAAERPVASPRAPFVPDDALIQNRIDRAAQYIAAGSEEGATQVARDLISGGKCDYAYAKYSPFSSRATASRALQQFRAQSNGQYPDSEAIDYTIVSSLQPVTNPKAVAENLGVTGAKFIGLGVVVRCPK